MQAIFALRWRAKPSYVEHAPPWLRNKPERGLVTAEKLDTPGLTDMMRVAIHITKGIAILELPEYLERKLEKGFKAIPGRDTPLQLVTLLQVTKKELMKIAGITNTEAELVHTYLQELGLDWATDPKFLSQFIDLTIE